MIGFTSSDLLLASTITKVPVEQTSQELMIGFAVSLSHSQSPILI